MGPIKEFDSPLWMQVHNVLSYFIYLDIFVIFAVIMTKLVVVSIFY